MKALSALALVLAVSCTPADPTPRHPPPEPAPPLAAAPADEPPLARVGRGTAIVFTPDLALPGNRAFYERLGFLYLEEADWRAVLARIEEYNAAHPARAVTAVLLETHGTNGHGLKLQRSKDPSDLRSYASVGALQEALEPVGVDRVYISACNAGRLFRPEIYRAIDRQPGDPLFLPPTLGVLDASPRFDPAASRVRVLRRASSHLETAMHGSTGELGPRTRRILERDGHELRFVVSTMLIQMLTGDPRLELTDRGWVSRRSRDDMTPAEAEALFQEFRRWLERKAGGDEGAWVADEGGPGVTGPAGP